MADLETRIAFDPEEGLVGLPDAMAVLAGETEAAGFRIDRHAIANELQAATFRCTAPGVVRVLVSPGGAVAIEMRAVS